MIPTRAHKIKIIENYLRDYNTYKIGILNCEKQLEYISPTLVSGYEGEHSYFFIGNNTANVAIDRIESKTAIALREEIERYRLITESIDRAVSVLQEKPKAFVQLRYFEGMPMQKVIEAMDYLEEKSAYNIRRKVLDKFLISLNGLISLR